jgi:hypothetical protein
VAAGDIHGDHVPKIITGAGPGSEARVSVFEGGTGNRLQTFLAFPEDVDGGVRVAAADVNGDGRSDIVAAEGPGGIPRVRAFDGLSLERLDQFFAYQPSFHGGVFVAGGGRWGNIHSLDDSDDHRGHDGDGGPGGSARPPDAPGGDRVLLGRPDWLSSKVGADLTSLPVPHNGDRFQALPHADGSRLLLLTAKDSPDSKANPSVAEWEEVYSSTLATTTADEGFWQALAVGNQGTQAPNRQGPLFQLMGEQAGNGG